MSSLWLGSKWKQRMMEESIVQSQNSNWKEKEKGKEYEREKNVRIPENTLDESEVVYNEGEIVNTENGECEEGSAEDDPCVISQDLLYDAVLQNNFELVETLLSKYGLDPNKKSENGSTALHLAAWKGFLTIVLCLLQYGADVNATQDRTGWTALHVSLRFGHEDLSSALVAAGASIDTLDSFGCSSMTFAALGGRVTILQYLIAQKLDVNHQPQGDDRSALPLGWDCPPLHTVCGLGNLDMVACLIVEGGADVNKRDSLLRTPLMYAVQENHTEVVQFLLDKGAKVNMYDAKGRTALHRAAKIGDLSMIDILLDGKADIYITDNEGLTPLDRLTNDEEGTKRAHIVEAVKQRKKRLVQNVLYTSAVGLASMAVLYLGGK